MGVHYPVSEGSYRIYYSDDATWSQGTAHAAGWNHPSRVIYKQTGAKDTVSFFISKGSSITMKFQYAETIDDNGVIDWSDVASGTINLSAYNDVITEAGVYNFITEQTESSISVVKVEPYTGNYYIRTDCVGSTKWSNYKAADHQMTYTEFSKSRETNTFGELFTHYYAHWCPRGTNVKFVIANDYSMCVSDTLVQDVDNPYDNIYPENDPYRPGELKAESYDWSGNITSDATSDRYSANIRFMYNEETNKISRAYVSSATNTTRKFLVLRSDTKFKNGDGSTLSGSGETSDGSVHEAIFQDNQDWIYEREIKLKPGQKFKLYASYAQVTPSENGSQYFRGNYDSNDWEDSDNYIEIIGGSGDTCKARVIYDFKTNRLVAAYMPEGAQTGTVAINADLMLIREHQGEATQLTFTTNESKLTEVKSVYGVMRFNRWILNNRQYPNDHDKDHSDTNSGPSADLIARYHPYLDAGSQKSVSERALYWISFPFDVNLSEVFGFGTYGTHWIIEYYKGDERAQQGYWADNDEGFWDYIWDRRGVTLKAGKGYVLALELDLMKEDNGSFWSNGIQQVELFFPSASSTTGTIMQTDVDVTFPSYQYDPALHPTHHDDRTIADSHWNIIGVPSYANYGSTLNDEGGTVTWQPLPTATNLPYLYEWNSNDNTYTIQSGTTYPFKAMHAYYVQYHGTLHWTLASANSPSSIVARRTYAEQPQNVEFRLELAQNEKMIDQTFVKLSNDEEVSAGFAFNEDLAKEFNAGKANIYTLIGTEPTAGNTMPMSEQTTVVPVGVKIATTGDYTFAIPSGTSGVGVTLVDLETGVRTNLALFDYNIALEAGDYTDRFVLEISPIQHTPTDFENVQGDDVQGTKVRKVLIDNVLYIIRDGKVFDARGAIVK